MSNGIRNTLVALFTVSAALLLATCLQLDETGVEAQAVKGGDVVTGNAFPAVAKLDIVLPPDPNPRPPIVCSGVLISANQVLTSARCTEDVQLLAGSVTVGFGNDGDSPGGITALRIEPHRYFSSENTSAFQVSIVVIPDQVITPALVSDVVIDASDVGSNVTLVGYGQPDDATALFSRLGAATTINLVAREFLTAGDNNNSSCLGDGGGPVFSGANTVIAVNQLHGSCTASVSRTRTDRHTADFIFRFIDQLNGPCLVDGSCVTVGCRTPDPDCPTEACGWGNTCEEDCPTRDWDCMLGSFAGDPCAQSGECEENGRCLAAADDDTFLYCTRPCEAGSTDQCPTNMVCQDNGSGNECTFIVPSPGSQGFECLVGTQCRSGICEDRICVNECDIASPACPANPTGGPEYICGPSKVQPGTNVCLGEDLSGGGGFCNAAGGRGGGGAALLLFIAMLRLRRRRRE